MESQLFELFQLLASHFRADFKRVVKDAPVTFVQFRILYSVASGTDTVGRLREEHGISQPAMSKTVDHMVTAGLLARVPSAQDRRQVRLKLTPQGQRAIRSIEKSFMSLLASRLNGVPTRERAAVRKSLEQLLSVLQRRSA